MLNALHEDHDILPCAAFFHDDRLRCAILERYNLVEQLCLAVFFGAFDLNNYRDVLYADEKVSNIPLVGAFLLFPEVTHVQIGGPLAVALAA